MFASTASSNGEHAGATHNHDQAGPAATDPGRQQDARDGFGHEQPSLQRPPGSRLLQEHALDHEGGAEHDSGHQSAPRSVVERRAGGSVGGPGRHRQ